MVKSYDELNQQATKVNGQISKYQTLYEENEKRIVELKRKIKEDYGVDDLDELRNLLKNLKKEEEEELLRVEKEISIAEPIIKEIEDGLKQLEA